MSKERRIERLEARVGVLQETIRLLIGALAKTLDRDAEIVLGELEKADEKPWLD